MTDETQKQPEQAVDSYSSYDFWESPSTTPSVDTQLSPESAQEPYNSYDFWGAENDPLAIDPEADESSFLADLGANIGAGAGELVDSAGWLLDVTGFDGAAESVHGWADSMITYFDEKISDESKAAMQKEFATITEGGDWYNPFDWERPEDAAGWKAALLHATRSIPATAVGMGGGAVASKALFKTATFLNKTYGSKKGIDALTKAAELGKKAKALGASPTDEMVIAGARAEKYLGFMSKTSGAIGMGLGEGAVSGAMTGNQVKTTILAMPHEQLMDNERYRSVFDATEFEESGAEMTFEERVKLARETIADQASTKAAMEAGLFTTLLGAPAGAILAPLTTGTQAAKAFASGKIRGAFKGAATETIQEMAQSGVEEYVQNTVVGEYDKSVKPWDNVFKAVITGGVAGGLTGGVMGGVMTQTRKGAAKVEQVQKDQDKHDADNYAVTAVAKNAMDNLMEKHGMPEEVAKQHVVQVLQKYAEDGEKIKAVTDLRFLSLEGRPREAEYQHEGSVEDYTEGRNITLEVKAGEVREASGIKHTAAYGEFDDTMGADGDPIDVFVGDTGTNAYVIEKIKPDGTFEQHKVMLGYDSVEGAINSFYDHAEDNTLGSIAQLRPEELGNWLDATTAQYQAAGVERPQPEQVAATEQPQGEPEQAEEKVGTFAKRGEKLVGYRVDLAEYAPAVGGDAGTSRDGDGEGTYLSSTPEYVTENYSTSEQEGDPDEVLVEVEFDEAGVRKGRLEDGEPEVVVSGGTVVKSTPLKKGAFAGTKVAEAKKAAKKVAKKKSKKKVTKKVAKAKEAAQKKSKKKVSKKAAAKKPPTFSLSKGAKAPWKVSSKKEGKLYITRHGKAAGTPSRTRQSANDLAIDFDEDVLIPEYAYYVLQSLQPKIAARASGTAQQAIKASDVDAILREHFSQTSKGQLYSLGEDKKPEQVVEKEALAIPKEKDPAKVAQMQKINEERLIQNMTLKFLADPTKYDFYKRLQAVYAGAYTVDEIAEARVEWAVHGIHSKYFKRWFGNSRTTDTGEAGGTPIKFFHSSRVDESSLRDVKNPEFEVFGMPKKGFLSFASARKYAVNHQSTRFKNKDNKIPVEGVDYNVYEVYVKANRIFDFKVGKQTRNLKKFLKNKEKVLAGEAKGLLQNFNNAQEGKDTERVDVTPENVVGSVLAGHWWALETPTVREFLKQGGFEAFYVLQGNSRTLNVFNGGDKIKGVSAQSTRVFDTKTTKAANYLYALRGPNTDEVFFSALESWVERGMQPKVKAKELVIAFTDKNSLGKKQIKREEVEDMGLIDWLTNQRDEYVTREDVLEYVRQNRLDLVEIESRGTRLSSSTRYDRGFGSETGIEYQYQLINDFVKTTLRENGLSAIQVEEVMDEYELVGVDALRENMAPTAISKLQAMMNQAKLDEWQDNHYKKRIGLGFGDVDRFSDVDIILRDKIKYGEWAMAGASPTYREMLMRVPKPREGATGTFNSKHWDDENVLLHLRFSGQFDSDTGNTVMLVEEIQSDWIQQGLKYGYGPEQTRFGKAPFAPMKDNWKLLGMKRIIRYAAENGYDQVAWVTGEAQTERFDISKQIDWVSLRKSEDTYDNGEAGYFLSYGQTNGPMQQLRLMTRWEVGDMIGEETIEKLIGKLDKDGLAQISGDEVKWEGRGMKNFYNNNLKKLTKNYIKKWGATVDLKQHMVQGKEESLWTFDVTDKMRDAVMKGQPLYSLSGNTFEELNRMLETFQLKSFIMKNTKDGIKPRVMKARIIDGMERGFYSPDIVRVTGVLDSKVLSSRSKVLLRIEQRSVYDPNLNLTGESLNKRVVEQETNRIKEEWKNAPEVEVHTDWRGLPDHIRQDVFNNGYQNRVEGVIDPLDNNKVHLVAANLTSLPRVNEVFTEEALGHYGVREFFGEEKLYEFLEEILPSVEGSGGWNRLMAAYPHLESDIRTGNKEVAHAARLRAAEELFVKQDVEQSVLDKIMAWMRSMLREMGLITTFTDNDLRRILARVHSNIINGTNPIIGGKRNHTSQYRVGNQMYSLYGSTLASQLEDAIKTFQPKDTPFNYLNRLKGDDSANLWRGRTEKSKKASQNLGFRENELEMNGVVDFLVNKYQTEPKVKVTRDQLIKVFNDTKPRIMAISRQGHYKFPSVPLRRLVEMKDVTTDIRFNRDQAEEHAGFFSERLKDELNNPEHPALLRLLGSYGYPDIKAEDLTPRALLNTNLLTTPFGMHVGRQAITPSMETLEERGQTSKQIGRMAGFIDIDAAVTYENSNAQIKGMVANQLISEIDSKGGFTSQKYTITVGIEGWRIEQVIARFSTTSDEDGQPTSFIADDPLFQERINRRVDEFRERLAERSSFVEQQRREGVIGPIAGDENFIDILKEEGRKYANELIEKIDDGSINSEEEALEAFKDVNPQLGLELFRTMLPNVTMNDRTALGTPTNYNNYRSASTHEQWTLNGGTDIDVLAIQMYDPPSGINRNLAGNTGIGTYHYDGDMGKEVVHLRVKTRISPSGGKVLGIEEVQSDWASNYKKSAPTPEATVKWVEKYGQDVLDIMELAENAFGWGIPYNTNYISRLTDGAYEPAYRREILEEPEALQEFMGTSFNSKMFDKMMEQSVDEDNLKIYRDLISAYKVLTPNWNTFPWQSTYYELALRSAVAWAIENDYEAVAWPEGSEVATLYGGYISEKINSFSVELSSMTLKAADIGTLSGSSNWDERINPSALKAAHGGYYNADYIEEIAVEGGENAEVAKRVLGYIDQYVESLDGTKTAQALDEIIPEDDKEYVRFDQDENTIYVRLPEPTLHNGKIHKLLYNKLLPQAARAIAKDTKAMQKAGDVSTGFIFIEDAYNSKKRGRRSWDGDGGEEGNFYRDGSNYDSNIYATDNPLIEGDFYSADFKMSFNERSNADASRRAMDAQLLGRDGAKLRTYIQNMLQEYADYSIDPVQEDIGRAFHNKFDDDSVREAARLYRDTKIDQGLLDVEFTMESVAVVGDADGDRAEPHLAIMNMSNNGDKGFNFGFSTWDDAGEPIYGLDRQNTMVSMFYGFAYKVMRDVWGIENPNPFVFRGGLFKEMFIEPFMQAVNDSVNGTQEGRSLHAVLTAQKTIFRNNPESRSTKEPAQYKPPKTSDVPPNMPILKPKLGIPDGAFLEWAKENAVIKDRMDAAMVMSVMRANNTEVDDMATFADLQQRMHGLPMAATGNDAFDIVLDDAIPENYFTPDTHTVEVEVEEVVEEQEAPQYTAENPEFIEQRWHAIYMTDRVRNKPVYLNFSLRNVAGTEKQLSIVNSKIAKSDNQLTVLDRVTNWTAGMKQSIASGDLLWGMKQGFLDDTASIERWEKQIMGNVQDAAISPHKMMHMTRNLPSVMAAIGKVGIPDMIDGAFQPVAGRKGFIDILRPLYEHPDGDLLDLWQGYAAARRSAELIQEKNEDGTSREKLFTQDEIVELLELGDKYPIFDRVFNDWRAFNNDLLNLATKQGVLSEAQREAWSQNDYVPFYRAIDAVEGEGQRMGHGLIKMGVSGQHHGIKRLRGSEKKLGNIIENMWFNTASLIDKVYKNEAMTRVVDMLDNIAMEKVPMPFEAIRLSNKELANALGRAGLMVGDHKTRAAKDKRDQLGPDFGDRGWLAVVEKMSNEQKLSWSTVFRQSKPVGDDIVSVMRNGKLVYYKVHDEDVLRTLNGMTASGLSGMMKAMGMSKSLLTKMITIDPSFMLANWMRDTLSAWVTSNANFVPVKDSIAAMSDIFKEEGAYMQMMMSGAGGGGFYDMTGGNMTKVLNDTMNKGVSTWIPKVFRGYMKLGAASENSNRVAIAQRILKNGGSVAEAMHAAQDIMNFTMTGDYSGIRFLVRTVPFMNARIQGLYRLGRGVRDNPVGFMLKGMALTAASLALLARNDDDPDYERLPEWMKDVGWNFFVDGVQYQIPKPFEVGLIFGTLPERMVRLMSGHDKLSVSGQRLMAAFGETLAFNPIPQLFKPIYEQGANKVFFTGNPIVNMAMSGLEYPYQYTPWTSDVAKSIGGMMPDVVGPVASPLRIQHAIRAYTGTVGLYALNAVDWAIRQARTDLPERPATKWYELPVVRRIVKGEGNISYHNKYSERIYDAISASDKAFKTINSLKAQGRVEEAKEVMMKRRNLLGQMSTKKDGSLKFANRDMLNKYRQEMREINEKQRAISSHPTLGGKEKRELLDALNKKRNAILDTAGPLLDVVEG